MIHRNGIARPADGPTLRPTPAPSASSKSSDVRCTHVGGKTYPPHSPLLLARPRVSQGCLDARTTLKPLSASVPTCMGGQRDR